jgi:hypothetical protein
VGTTTNGWDESHLSRVSVEASVAAMPRDDPEDGGGGEQPNPMLKAPVVVDDDDIADPDAVGERDLHPGQDVG